MFNFDTITNSMILIDMEEFKKKSAADGDKEIVFSKAIKAGKRIYYLDVKKNRKDEMFLAISIIELVMVSKLNIFFQYAKDLFANFSLKGVFDGFIVDFR